MNKKSSAAEDDSSPTNDSQQIVSDDDEIDYSVKPEFYDPNLDDKDELWAHKQRRGHTSDALLSCPACFTTLCLDCQRHEKYVNQYRAMFVVNCKITNESPPTGSKRKRNRKPQTEAAEKTKRVCCSVCSTEVGVIDEDEVYHFLNVLPSEA